MERLLARLERRFGRYSIPRLTYYLVALQGIVLFAELARPGFVEALTLDRELVLKGQIWRLVSYLAIPPSTSPLWALFALYWFYTIGSGLEEHWGSFKYQIYWLIGMLGTTVCAFVLGVPASNTYLLMSLFLAFATVDPDYQILVFFVLPLKVKWLALLDVGLLALTVATLDGWHRLMPIVAVGNYLLFFAPILLDRLRGSARRGRQDRRFQEMAPAPVQRRCSVCGATDEDRDLEFRVCTCERCGGQPTEFCLAHAREHRNGATSSA